MTLLRRGYRLNRHPVRFDRIHCWVAPHRHEYQNRKDTSAFVYSFARRSISLIMDTDYNILKIPKGNGKFRTIYAPNKVFKTILVGKVAFLQRVAQMLDRPGVCHAFMPRRSPVTNAWMHIGKRHTLSFDLKDFFDHVTIDRVERAILHPNLMTIVTHKNQICRVAVGKIEPNPAGGSVFRQRESTSIVECFADGSARQGFPTSPALANIAGTVIDREILKQLRPKARPHHFVYTRYADDLTFSFNDPVVGRMLLSEVPRIVLVCGFEINRDKTKWQSAASGRRIITGVAVGDSGVYAPREIRRKLRAAMHQVEHGIRRRNACRIRQRLGWKAQLGFTKRRLIDNLRGLQEWARLKKPKKQAVSLMRPVLAKQPGFMEAAVKTINQYVRRFPWAGKDSK